MITIDLAEAPAEETNIQNNTFNKITMASVNNKKPSNLLIVEYKNSSRDQNIYINGLIVESCVLELKEITLPNNDTAYLMKFLIYKSNILVSDTSFTGNDGSLHYASLAALPVN